MVITYTCAIASRKIHFTCPNGNEKALVLQRKNHKSEIDRLEQRILS